jgi:DNA-binding response OmpR family regulator
MVIDDDRTHLDMAEEVMGELFEVTLADSGAQALSLVRRGFLPDLILLDIDMPGMDGYETFARIRKIEPLAQNSVIFLTGMTQSHIEVSVLELGAQDYITKPFIKENLLARVRLRLKEARRVGQMQGTLKEVGFDEEKFKTITNRLTASESDVARLMALGYVHGEIARQLNYTAGYVRNLATLIYDKLEIQGKKDLRDLLRK